MLAKLTSKNQLTLPKSALSAFPTAEYFEVTADAVVSGDADLLALKGRPDFPIRTAREFASLLNDPDR